jgi:hypothetical protein
MSKPNYVQDTWQHRKAYTALSSLNDRCRNPLSPYYKDYGGRGITVCSRWTPISEEAYNNFISDIGLPPDKTYSVDRENNSVGYFPTNCKWATAQEQALNRRARNFIPQIVYKKLNKTWAITYQNGSEHKTLMCVASEIIAEKFAQQRANKLGLLCRKG